MRVFDSACSDRPTRRAGEHSVFLGRNTPNDRPSFGPKKGSGARIVICHIENWAFSSDFDRPTDRLTDRPTLSGAKEGRSKEGRKFRPTDSPVLGPTLGRIPYFQLSTPCTYYTHSSRFELPFRGFAILQASAILAAHCCGAVAGGSKQSGNALHEVCRASLPPVRPCRCVVRTRCVTCKLEG